MRQRASPDGVVPMAVERSREFRDARPPVGIGHVPGRLVRRWATEFGPGAAERRWSQARRLYLARRARLAGSR